jgi:hypothetical protein
MLEDKPKPDDSDDTRPDTPKGPTVATVARDALDAAKGNALQATEIMVDRVQGNFALYRALMDPLLRESCYNAISAQIRAKRQKVYNTPQPSKAKARASVAALAAGNGLFDFPLPGGLRLGDAMRDDVAAAAAFYQSQATDMGHKAAWLGLILHALPKGKKVKDALTAAKLEALKEEACSYEDA